MKKVSVIMNCLNSTQYLREAIDSIYGQTYSNWEIILWDNNSTEDVRSFLVGYDQRLRYYSSNQTVSLGEARNKAISKSHGSLIAFLDCDDIWRPKKLSQCVPYFSDEEVGLVYTNWILFNSKGYNKVVNQGIKQPEGWVFEDILFNNFTCLSTLIFRRVIAFEDQIKFDPKFNYLEDTDFLIRIAREWKFAYVPISLTRYRMHSKSASANKVDEFRKEMFSLIEKVSALYPDVKTRYNKKLHALNIKDTAVDNWRRGDRSTARSLLRPKVFINWKYFLIYFIFFLPYPFVNWFKNRLTNNVDYQY